MVRHRGRSRFSWSNDCCFLSPGVLQLLGAAAGTTGRLGAVAEGAIVGAGPTAGAVEAVVTGTAVAETASTAAIVAATIVGSVGIAVVGCDGYSWDCWKPVVRDASTSPSRGMTLRDLAANSNVRSITLGLNGFVVGNTFGDCFCLSTVNGNGALAFDASHLEPGFN